MKINHHTPIIPDADRPLIRGRAQKRTWFLVANGQNALVFHKAGNELEQIADITPTNEMTQRKAQKTRNTSAGGEGSVYFTSDPMDHEDVHNETVFLQNVADWLEKAREDGGFDALVVAASPRALGILRDNLDHRIKDIVVREIDKDYTNTPLAELENVLIKTGTTH